MTSVEAFDSSRNGRTNDSLTETSHFDGNGTNGNVNSSLSSKSKTSELPDPWPAPDAEGRLNATVVIPGSKSLSNRYLILAALGHKPVTIAGMLRSRDTELMAGALRTLGVGVEFDPDEETRVTVTPPADGRFNGDVTVFCGLAGTVMRFVPGLALFADGPVRFDGDEQAYARPMHPLLDGLEQLGAHVEYEGKTGFLPFTITPPQVQSDGEQRDGGDRGFGVSNGSADSSAAEIAKVEIDSSSSSQFISSLLLIGSRLPAGLDLRHTGAKLPSMPHIRMTMADVNGAGGNAEMPEIGHWQVAHLALQLPDGVVVEPDLSNAAPFLGAAMIAGGAVSVPNWPTSTTQPGGLLPDILQKMGATVTLNGRAFDDVMANARNPQKAAFVPRNGTLTVSMDGPICGLGKAFDMSAAGEIAPSIAALATLADSPSELVGIGHLRGHETNRLAALVTEITRIGAGAKELPDGLAITPVLHDRLHGEIMETYADHRMATFAAMIGLAVPNTRIRNIATTRKTIPDFPGMWRKMLES
ncbi:3-phosphoshikimate 1-carboxyvinyltransferase [Bifidobacterium sp. ESL0704]|uniref:3-phosphoshikimate 1-carboxyvinyltransferase n=1 Tax=Bifidobacterium sp. ESL0704 TaxID=2983219 RepID=UPI0023F929D3|nr:3-phosphoshikimate 1-carboxyvinyltransferase [Bifidobacterium sp. ESL0704]WEV52380.1 3-phosphoshikimate 1-carboxyvinyltransferase [Bifidobacterium sp. ESL0704]